MRRNAIFWACVFSFLALAGCRAPTYDERMRSVDELFTCGNLAEAESELSRQTDGRVSPKRTK